MLLHKKLPRFGESFQFYWKLDFFTLFVHRSNINHIPTTSLRSKKFKNILIASSNVDFLFNDDLNTTNDVELIHLNDVFFAQPFNWEWFRPLKNLTYFNLQYSSVPMLNARILENFSTELGYFLLSNTNTSRLEDGVFANLENLIELKVRNSLIVDLKRSMFPAPAKLQKMDFTGNLIESFPDDLFSNMPELEIVLLEKNRIAYISHSLFGFISHRLGLLSLMGNPLICDCNLRWLENETRQIVHGHCAQPEHMKEAYLTNLTAEDFDYCEINNP
ncbi:uncharacterized protein TNIN_326881 [Trichonephila inaurata madagascariensis]|uniref:LRRCT domain-containing protein n=1 Tax=Trichonephila inaurata madagascariensis TaxID=2747483 RepID=A0A8X7C1L3_9ARAC|nr:uncharacterized protein TNIN_326881 [Trichonephila inaurata madagascariensis]